MPNRASYLILDSHIGPGDKRWLIKYALQVAPYAWIHNNTVPGGISLRLGETQLNDLQDQIIDASAFALASIEDKIKTNSLRGVTKELKKNQLNTIVQSCNDLKLIDYAKSLLEILGQSEPTRKPLKPNEVPRDNPLGVDKKSTEAYLLELAKKSTIH